jgi:hypothetical protein
MGSTPQLYLDIPESPDLVLKSIVEEDPELFLKANPNRDPSVGQYISGGSHKGIKPGSKELDDAVTALLDQMPESKIAKDK